MLRAAAMLPYIFRSRCFLSRTEDLRNKAQTKYAIADKVTFEALVKLCRSFTILFSSAGIREQLHAASPKQTLFFPRFRVTQFQANAPNNEVMSTSRTTSNLHDEHGRGEKVKNSEGTTCPGAKEAKATDYIGQRGKHERGPTQGRQ